jgi:hypothetical protein
MGEKSMNFPYLVLLLFAFAWQESQGRYIKIKAFKTLFPNCPIEEDLARIQFQECRIIMERSSSSEFVKSIRLKEFFEGLELIQAILFGKTKNYMEELAFLGSEISDYAKDVNTLRDVRLTLFYHSFLASRNLTEVEKEALVQTIRKIDQKFQELFCIGISKETVFSFPVLVKPPTPNAFLYIDQSKLVHLNSFAQDLSGPEAAMEPYFFLALSTAALRSKKGKARTGKFSVQDIFKNVLDLYGKSFVIDKNQENSFHRLITRWNTYKEWELEYPNFPYGKILKGFVQFRIFGDVPFISHSLYSQDSSIINKFLMECFLVQVMALKIHLDCYRKWLKDGVVSKETASVLMEIYGKGYEFLASIKSILEKSGYLAKSKEMTKIILAILKKDVDYFTNQNAKAPLIPVNTVTFPEFSVMSIEKDLGAFVTFTYDEARFFDQKLFDLIYLFFIEHHCPSDIGKWSKVYEECIENPSNVYLHEHSKLNSKLDGIRIVNYLGMMATALFAKRRLLEIDTTFPENIINHFAVPASLIGTANSQLDPLIRETLSYGMTRYFSWKPEYFLVFFDTFRKKFLLNEKLQHKPK